MSQNFISEDSNSSFLDLHTLVAHQTSVDSADTLDVVRKRFETSNADFAAVLHGNQFLGLSSRAMVGTMLGSRFGFSIFSDAPISNHLIEGAVSITVGTPLLEVLEKAFARREGAFYYDVALIQESGVFLGLISVENLVRAQSRFVAQNLIDLRHHQQLLETANLELIHARDAALGSARIKSEFLANMSHEIRTPMNGVIGMIDLLCRTTLDAEQQEMAETIHYSANSLLTIINDVLDFSKIEAGKMRVQICDCDLIHESEEVVRLLSETAYAKGLEVDLIVSETVSREIKTDCMRLRQILLNLVGNAIKFTESGSVILRVDSNPERIGGVTFEVRDTGIGIERDAQAKLFQAFTQADGSNTRKYGGTGLGLAISKRIAELMGGDITLKSEPGAGSSFTLFLPGGKPIQSGAFASPILHDRVLIVGKGINAGLRHCFKEWGMTIDTNLDERSLAIFLQNADRQGIRYPIIVVDPTAELFWTSNSTQDPMVQDSCVIACLRPNQNLNQIERLTNVRVLRTPIMPTALKGALLAAKEFLSAKSEACQKSISLQTKPNPPVAHVLVAEDNPVNQKVIGFQLRKLGCTMRLTQTGSEALAALNIEAFDLILMDCQMPELDGFDVTRQIRIREKTEWRERPRVRIAAFTAHAFLENNRKCIESGMDSFLTKPVSMDQLRAEIELVRAKSTQ